MGMQWLRDPPGLPGWAQYHTTRCERPRIICVSDRSWHGVSLLQKGNIMMSNDKFSYLRRDSQIMLFIVIGAHSVHIILLQGSWHHLDGYGLGRPNCDDAWNVGGQGFVPIALCMRIDQDMQLSNLRQDIYFKLDSLELVWIVYLGIIYTIVPWLGQSRARFFSLIYAHYSKF